MNHPIDYSKSRLYVIGDFLTKSATSLALIVLGVVGWRLQQRVADTRDSVETRERQERRYLPMLRTLTELEIVLEAITTDLSRAYPEKSHDTNFADGPEMLAWYAAAVDASVRLRYAANSLYLPDGDVRVSVLVPGPDNSSFAVRMQMPLRAALLMYADWIESGQNFRESPNAAPFYVTVSEQGGWIEMRGDDPDSSSSGTELIDRGSIPAWHIWLNTRKVRAREVPFPFAPIWLARLRNEIAKVTHDTLRQHPEIADKYVAIRSEAIRDTITHKR